MKISLLQYCCPCKTSSLPYKRTHGLLNNFNPRTIKWITDSVKKFSNTKGDKKDENSTFLKNPTETKQEHPPFDKTSNAKENNT